MLRPYGGNVLAVLLNDYITPRAHCHAPLPIGLGSGARLPSVCLL